MATRKNRNPLSIRNVTPEALNYSPDYPALRGVPASPSTDRADDRADAQAARDEEAAWLSSAEYRALVAPVAEPVAEPVRTLEIDDISDDEYTAYLARLDQAEAARDAALADLAALATRRAARKAAPAPAPARILECEVTDAEYEAYLGTQERKEREDQAARDSLRAERAVKGSVTVIIVGRFDGIEY